MVEKNRGKRIFKEMKICSIQISFVSVILKYSYPFPYVLSTAAVITRKKTKLLQLRLHYLQNNILTIWLFVEKNCLLLPQWD